MAETKIPYSGPYVARRDSDGRGWKGISVYAEGGKVAICNMVMDPFRGNEWKTAQLIAEALNEHAARE